MQFIHEIIPVNDTHCEMGHTYICRKMTTRLKYWYNHYCLISGVCPEKILCSPQLVMDYLMDSLALNQGQVTLPFFKSFVAGGVKPVSSIATLQVGTLVGMPIELDYSLSDLVAIIKPTKDSERAIKLNEIFEDEPAKISSIKIVFEI